MVFHHVSSSTRFGELDPAPTSMLTNLDMIHFKRLAVLNEEAPLQINGDALTPYDYIKSTLAEFAKKQTTIGREISDEAVREEGARCILEWQTRYDPQKSLYSWFWDAMISDNSRLEASSACQSTTDIVRSNTREQLTRQPRQTGCNVDCVACCEFERQLSLYTGSQRMLGISPSDRELKLAACRIIMEYDSRFSNVESTFGCTWFCDRIMNSDDWVAQFRIRNGLGASTDPLSMQVSAEGRNQSTHGYQVLEETLLEFINQCAARGLPPSDADIQRQAKLILYGADEPQLLTIAEDAAWLSQLKSRSLSMATRLPRYPADLGYSLPWTSEEPTPFQALENASHAQQHLASALSQYITAVMSHQSRVPNDEELRRQARLIVYNSNKINEPTLADNPAWLSHFKRALGLQTTTMAFPEERQLLTGYSRLGTDFNAIPLSSQSIPSHTSSSSGATSTPSKIENLYISIYEHNPSFPVNPQSLEAFLGDYVSKCLQDSTIPTDEQLRAKARHLLGLPRTPLDDPALLARFKDFYRLKYGFTLPSKMTVPNNNPISPSSPRLRRSSTTPQQSRSSERLTAHWQPTRRQSTKTSSRNRQHTIMQRRGGEQATAPESNFAPVSVPLVGTTHIDPYLREQLDLMSQASSNAAPKEHGNHSVNYDAMME
jgi:hypothetical protein